MHSPRFFCATSLSDARGEVELPPEVARHVAQALRMRVGDALTLFDGDGGEYAATVVRIDKRGVAVRVGAFDAVEREVAQPTTLVQSILAADMMDLVVRKAVELGVGAIAPVIAERSQRAPEERTAKRIERWRQIAISACEQCGRNRVPAIADIVALPAWLDRAGAEDNAVVLTPDAQMTYGALVCRSQPRFVVVGPEGGFTAMEIAHAERRGAALARLGPATLRAETAALAALAVAALCGPGSEAV